jgi:asparagine synthase (glutamine-hydrolysing)
MSVQFGRWNFDGQPAEPEYLNKVREILAPYGPDGMASYSDGAANILYRALHTTRESRQERQPCRLESAAVLTWDGRLDNRAEFIGLMRDRLSQDSEDVAIVAAAYERWGTDCFARLVGDWALAVWNPADRSLILAKDPIGTHHLYYAPEPDRVTWSSVLDPLVLLARKTLALDEEYIAGWLGTFPATDLTPYAGIFSVPPAYFVRLVPTSKIIAKFWDFDPKKRIRYASDAEYEEHFRTVLQESVRRRLRSDAPVLAELSGGMDSSSIVCVADALIAEGAAETPRLDTVSYYDDSEPHWDERPYFTKVEEQRDRAGFHIDVSQDHAVHGPLHKHGFSASPGAMGHNSIGARELSTHIAAQGYRVLLSGLGGDEVTGGVPTPLPELEDLLATGRIFPLAHRLKVWALDKRKPLLHLLLETVKAYFPATLVRNPKNRQLAPWLSISFAKRHQKALTGYDSRLEFFGHLPSFQENLSTLDDLRRQLACDAPRPEPCIEKRYPYLDRDLLEFLFAIPREQLVRPGQRRSLMRRALAGIVPGELLGRRRKAFVSRGPAESIAVEWASLTRERPGLLASSLGLVDEAALFEAVERARRGQEVQVVTLMRTLALERWLRHVRDHGPVQRAGLFGDETVLLEKRRIRPAVNPA